ncbi:hypothetical protein [Spirosoma sp. 209]|uniref:hypothetical protein n=1 Tax=Spirosoma sp. 209 TaxID=1955701 RepID=UPI00098D218F|nr:hypothetical protein [Spirosoma sp. 209]
MSHTVQCPKCGAVDDYRTSNSGPHIRADCNSCGSFIKFLPQHSEPICYIGKYKGTPISAITDKSWLLWVLENVMMKGTVRRQLHERLNQLP